MFQDQAVQIAWRFHWISICILGILKTFHSLIERDFQEERVEFCKITISPSGLSKVQERLLILNFSE